MIKKFEDWFYCFHCKRDVRVSIVVDQDRYDGVNRSVDVIVSAICLECGSQLASGNARVELIR